MIRLWLLVLIAVAAGSAIAYGLRFDTGYVVLSYGGWIMETSVLALAGTVVIGAPLTIGLLRLLIAALRLPATVLRYRARRQAERARDSFEAGLLKLLEGHWQRAEIELVRRAADHHAGHLNYLAAARAAQRVGASDRRDHYLNLAARGEPALEFATWLTQAELQRERGEYALAKITAQKLREADPRHPYPVELLAECHAALREWPELHALLREGEKLGSPPPGRRRELLLLALSERMKAAITDAKLDQLKSLWEQTPPSLRQDTALRRLYVSGLSRLNAHAEAAALITATLRQEWDGELVGLYGQLHASDPVAQLATIEQWLGLYGEKAELLITAGRACLANKLWGKARSYLEAARRSQPTPTAFLELARMCEQTQNAEEAQRLYKQGLELAAR
jgi:HemY protein